MFISEKNYKWDDFERKGYGGKYPGAANSTGSGNYTEAGKILRGVHPYNNTTTAQLLEEHQHHAVVLRGMRLTFYWLMLFKPNYFKNNANGIVAQMAALQLQPDAELLNRIAAIITIHLNRLFSNPRPDLPDDMKFKLIANLAPVPINPLTTPPPLQLCYFFLHKTEAANDNAEIGEIMANYFHRINYTCKLVPEYIREENQKDNVYWKGKSRNITSNFKISGVNFATGLGLSPCPCCYKTSHVNRVSRPILVAYKNNRNTYHKTMLDQPGACYQDFFADTVKLSLLTTVPQYQGHARIPCQTCWPAPGGLPPEQLYDRLTITI